MLMEVILFNFYMSKLPTYPPDVRLITYADKFFVYTFGVDPQVLFGRLNFYL